MYPVPEQTVMNTIWRRCGVSVILAPSKSYNSVTHCLDYFSKYCSIMLLSQLLWQFVLISTLQQLFHVNMLSTYINHLNDMISTFRSSTCTDIATNFRSAYVTSDSDSFTASSTLSKYKIDIKIDITEQPCLFPYCNYCLKQNWTGTRSNHTLC